MLMGLEPILFPSAVNSTVPCALRGELITRSIGNRSPVKAIDGMVTASIRRSGFAGPDRV
jgi:hypothetical protein